MSIDYEKLAGIDRTVYECWYISQEFDGCCCKCKYLAKTTRDDIDGYACTVFLETDNIIYIGWPEHGLCELFTLKLFDI